jgi:hypothetical protein
MEMEIGPMRVGRERSKDKRRALGELKEEINRTEEHLRSLRSKYDPLQKENMGSPFERVPVEILSAIFEEVHEPGRNESIPPFSIIDDDLITLMLVCKAWHRTVLNTPQLWSSIKISNPPSDGEDAYSWMRKQCVYVGWYITQSKSTMLDIDLNLKGLMDGEEYWKSQHPLTDRIAQSVEYPTSIREVPGPVNFLFNKEVVDRRLEEAFWDFERSKGGDDGFEWCWESGVRDQCIYNYYKLLAALTRMLVGKEGTVMQRWLSFKFVLPSFWEGTGPLWPFNEYLPLSLEELDLQALDDDLVLSIVETPPLPSLLKLSLSGWVTLNHVPDCPNLLDLDISFPKRWKGINRLVQFSFLQTLRISAENMRHKCPPVPDLHFPQLRSLFLTTATPLRLLQAFKLKSLNKFILEEAEGSVYGRGAAIPDASVFLVTQVMIYLTEDTGHRLDEREISSGVVKKQVKRQDDASYSAKWKRTLISLFPQLKSAHTIGTNQMLLNLAVKTAKECQNNGNLPLLRSILEVDEWENIFQPPYASFSSEDLA